MTTDVLSDGGSPITSSGVCWSSTSIPTVSDNKTVDEIIDGKFSSVVPGITDGLFYNFRAYAINAIGISYSNVIVINTILPQISISSSIANKTDKTITVDVSLSSGGGNAITASGICWSLSPSPTIGRANTESIELNLNDGYSVATITGLTGNTKYYIRGYADNGSGIKYSNQLLVGTFGMPEMINTVLVQNITRDSVTIGGQLLAINGLNLLRLGARVGTSPNIQFLDKEE